MLLDEAWGQADAVKAGQIYAGFWRLLIGDPMELF